MEKFKVTKKKERDNKAPLLVQLDKDLQRWVRVIAAQNDSTITEVMHQIITFAKKHS
jgi:succinate dehydrogenase flavin-adding protein (antitoxin of CptAB toxin-antitoxin module)